LVSETGRKSLKIDPRGPPSPYVRSHNGRLAYVVYRLFVTFVTALARISYFRCVQPGKRCIIPATMRVLQFNRIN
jgi:hypothetical protein